MELVTFVRNWLLKELNYHDQKIRRTPTHDTREHWTAVLTLLGLISSVYRNLHHWRSNQRPQIVVPKLYNWATSSYRTQVTPNQLVMVIAQPNNLNVSCKLYPYSFQRTQSPPRITSSQEALLVCDMNWWLSSRVLALQSVVAGSISSGGDYGIHCWWDLTAVQCFNISCVGVRQIFWL